MKPPVIGPGPRIQDVRRNRPAGRTTGGAFAVHLPTGAPEEPPAVIAAAEAMGLDALLALQGVGPDAAGDRRRAAREHGESLLERLDRLRSDLLLGRISPSRLAALTEQMRLRPPLTGDERLDAILGEIELRAEVELAKLARTSGSTGD